MAFVRSQLFRNLLRSTQSRAHSNLLGSSRYYSRAVFSGPEIYHQGVSSFLCNNNHDASITHGSMKLLCSTMGAQPSIFLLGTRSMTKQVKAPPQVRQMGATQVAMLSPGFIYEPYAPREPIPFWRRWFTRNGWKRTKEDVILEMKSAYAISKLRKSGYSKHQFYSEAFGMYKEINTLIANGDKALLRKTVTDRMFSALKNELKQRESVWNKVYWAIIEPAIKIRTLRARLIGVDRNDLNKVFVQLTLEFMTKQKFAAYNSKGDVVAGDKDKEVLVRDIWVFEKSLFHPDASWRLCGRINV